MWLRVRLNFGYPDKIYVRFFEKLATLHEHWHKYISIGTCNIQVNNITRQELYSIFTLQVLIKHPLINATEIFMTGFIKVLILIHGVLYREILCSVQSRHG